MIKLSQILLITSFFICDLFSFPILTNQPPHTVQLGNIDNGGDIHINFPTDYNLIINNGVRFMPAGNGIALQINESGDIKVQLNPNESNTHCGTHNVHANTSEIFNLTVKEFTYIDDARTTWGFEGIDISENAQCLENFLVMKHCGHPVAIDYHMILMAMFIELKHLRCSLNNALSDISSLQSTISNHETRIHNLENPT